MGQLKNSFLMKEMFMNVLAGFKDTKREGETKTRKQLPHGRGLKREGKDRTGTGIWRENSAGRETSGTEALALDRGTQPWSV